MFNLKDLAVECINRIQSYMREKKRSNREVLNVPPFTLFFHPTKTDVSENLGIPDIPIAGTLKAKFGHFHDLFHARQRQPSFQYIDTFSPELAPELQANGYRKIRSKPIMVCTPESYLLPPMVPNLEIVTLSEHSSIEYVMEGLDANALGFDMEASLASEKQAQEFREILSDCRAFTARLGSQAVGAGMYNPMHDHVTELTGIATLKPFRRKGIASHLTAFASQVAFDHGAELLFLIPDSEKAGRVYQGVGFHIMGNVVTHTLSSVIQDSTMIA